MARAGFYEIRSSNLRFGRDGVWYADGEPIANQRIARLFSKHLARKGDGSYEVRIGPDRAEVEVEDTPFVVRQIDGDREHGFRMTLSDDSEEPLALDSLAIGKDEVLYCRVKGGSERARFLRPAFYQLSRFIEETEAGVFLLRAGGATHRISRA